MLAVIITNEKYDKTGMVDLPAVVNDHSNIRQTIVKMGVPDTPENIFELRDVSW